MSRVKRHTELGVHWLTCGWRLFGRNPWLFGGMGVCASALVALLWAIPLLGGSLIAFLAPIVLASFYLVIDRVSKLNMPLPAILRRAALKSSPRELFLVFRDESRIMPMVVVSLYSMFASVLTNIILWSIAGSGWTKSWTSLSVFEALAVLAAIVVGVALYFLLAASIVYALPRAFLRDKPLIPEMWRSFRAGMHYLFALAVVFGPLLLSALAGLLMSLVSVWLVYFVALFVNAVALPLLACSLYCSYRTVYQPRPPVAAHA